MFLFVALLQMLEKGGSCVLLRNAQIEQLEGYFVVCLVSMNC